MPSTSFRRKAGAQADNLLLQTATAYSTFSFLTLGF